MVGRVVSVKMINTAVVLVEQQKTHPLYKKAFTRSKKYMADDPVGVKLGDIVEVVKIKPISKNKHWQVKKVLGTDIVTLGTQALKVEAAEAIAEVLPEEEVKQEAIEAKVEVAEPSPVVASEGKLSKVKKAEPKKTVVKKTEKKGAKK